MPPKGDPTSPLHVVHEGLARNMHKLLQAKAGDVAVNYAWSMSTAFNTSHFSTDGKSVDHPVITISLAPGTNGNVMKHHPSDLGGISTTCT